MIVLKELQNRVYSGKTCVRFEYEIPLEENRVARAVFERQSFERAEWNMQIVFNRTKDKDSEVYNFGYVMPRDGLPLELIAASGLRFFQLHIKREIQEKSNLDFILGDIIQGM